MSKVNVIIIPDGGNTELVKEYFTNALFNVIDTPVLTVDDNYEMELVKSILKQYNNQHIILIKDTSRTSLNSDQIAEYVTEALTIDVDLYYMARWDDQCQMSKHIENKPNFLRTYAPHGYQAIMFYPKSIPKIIKALTEDTTEKVLFALIYAGIITAICNSQNIFYYDAFKYATSNSLFQRLNVCSPTTLPNQVSETNKYLYIGGILILIFLVVWGMRKMGPKSNPDEQNKPDDLLNSLVK